MPETKDAKENAARQAKDPVLLAKDNSEIMETVKIEDRKAPGGHVVINTVDFDEKKHKKFVEKE